MQGLFVAAVYVAMVALGFGAPFLFGLGYVWVDASRPQDLSPLLSGVPTAFILGSCTFVSYIFFDRRYPPPLSLRTVLTLFMAVWVTLTTTWAVAPFSAWEKWDWAFKTVLFSALVPYIIRSRVQIEAFLYIYILSLGLNILPFGLKTIVSGGGYGKALGAIAGNSGLAESSTLAAVSVMCIPILLSLSKYSVLFTWRLARRTFCVGYVVLCVGSAIGTYARTGLIALLVLSALSVLRSRHKFLLLLLVLAFAALAPYLTASDWQQRMSTVETYNTEDSALGRILVWKWTVNYALENPLGGGFNSFVIDEIQFPPEPGQDIGQTIRGKAFHSIYFEVLGEHGWIGLFAYLLLLLMSMLSLWRTSRRCRREVGLEWCSDLAGALLISLVVMSVSGCFIGIAFQPMIWYLIAGSICVSTYSKRVLNKAPASSRQPREMQNTRRVPASVRQLYVERS